MSSKVYSAANRKEHALLALSATATVLAGLVEVAGVMALAETLTGTASVTPSGPAGLLLILTVVWACLTAVAVVAGRTCGYALSAAIQDSIAVQLLRLPMSWFNARREGEISFLLGPQVMQVMSIPAHLLVPGLRAMVVPLALVLLVGLHSPSAAALALAWLPVLAIVQWWSARRAASGDVALAEARAQAADRVLEYLDAQRTVRLSPRPGHAARLVHGSVRELSRRMDAQVDPVVRVLGLFTLAVNLMFLSVLTTGFAIPGGDSTPARAVAFVLASCCLFSVLQGAASLSATLRAAIGAAGRINGFLSMASLSEPDHPTKVRGLGKLEVQGLSVCPDDGQRILDGVDLVAEPGSLTALVGASGAGKTTLLRTLARFWDPAEGTVLMDGVDYRQIGSQEIHRHISMVFQDVELLSGSLADNIRIGLPSATDMQVAEAARRAGMTEMLQRLPRGLDSIVGEHGVGLSGGERQRVCVARALVKQAPILLLDEPAASLDPTTRRQVEKTVKELHGQVTVVLVTHHLEAAASADQILVLDAGRVVETGTHKELLSRNEHYARLWLARTSLDEPEER